MSEHASFPDRGAGTATDGLQCPECGYDLTGLPGRVCPECGNPFEIRQVVVAGSPSPSYIVLSVVVLLFCFLGIVPLVFSILTLTANSRQEYIAAKRHSKSALVWNLIALTLGVALMSIGFLGGF